MIGERDDDEAEKLRDYAVGEGDGYQCLSVPVREYVVGNHPTLRWCKTYVVRKYVRVYTVHMYGKGQELSSHEGPALIDSQSKKLTDNYVILWYPPLCR